MKIEHLQKAEDKRQNETSQVPHHYHGPRVIRGGSSVNEHSNPPKSLRGGGGKSNLADSSVPEMDDNSFTKQASNVTSGLISRLLGAK